MIIIIGAGPAGLSTTAHLRDDDHLVLEAAGEPGGLCRSFELGGTVFDIGGHAFFTKHDHVRDLMNEWCAPGLHVQPRQAWVHSHDTFVRYPFQSHLYGLPVDVVQDCLAGLLEAAQRQPDETPPDSMLAWIEACFGPGIAKHFLLPYNEKVWAHPLDQVASGWTANRVVMPDRQAIIAGALRPQDYRTFPNATVSYPARGGFFELFRGMADRAAGHIRYNTRVRKVDLRRRTVTTADGTTVRWDRLVSSMPLDELVRCCPDLPDSCRDAAAVLRWNSLALVNLVFDGADRSEFHRIYSADPQVPFHKLVLNSNSSPDLRDRSRFAVQAEISFSEHKPLDRTGLRDRVLAAIRRMDLIGGTDEPVAADTRTVGRAYPIQTLDTASARRHLVDTFERYGVLCAGRFGEWRYINSDDAVMRGKQCAEELDSA